MEQNGNLQRKLGLWATVSIVAGSVIGSSIFMKPSVMAQQLQSPLLLLLVWVFAGIVSFIGAMINAEIGAMLPVTGGQYVFFKKMYGNAFAFLYGWAAFAVINTASVAAIAYVFAQYTEYFVHLPRFSAETEHSLRLTIPYVGHVFPLENIGVKLLAVLVILFLTVANYISVKFGSSLQVFFSVIKVAALLFLVVVIFFSSKGQAQHLITPMKDMAKNSWQTVLGFIAAISGAFAAYDGWNNIGFVAGEIKEPSKNIPRGLFIGLGICVLLYVLTNEAYLYMLPIDKVAASSLLATDAVTPVLGAAGAGLIAAMVMISTFGATNGNILACARVTFSMGAAKDFFLFTGKVHKHYKTPGNALWLHALWTCLFVFSGSFDMLTDLFVFVTWIFYGFAAFGIFVLRKKMPNAERPFKIWGYPWLPVFFVLFTAFYVVITIYNDITNYTAGRVTVINSVLGLLITIAGLPLYWLFTYFNKKRAAKDA